MMPSLSSRQCGSVDKFAISLLTHRVRVNRYVAAHRRVVYMELEEEIYKYKLWVNRSTLCVLYEVDRKREYGYTRKRFKVIREDIIF